MKFQLSALVQSMSSRCRVKPWIQISVRP